MCDNSRKHGSSFHKVVQLHNNVRWVGYISSCCKFSLKDYKNVDCKQSYCQKGDIFISPQCIFLSKRLTVKTIGLTDPETSV